MKSLSSLIKNLNYKLAVSLMSMWVDQLLFVLLQSRQNLLPVKMFLTSMMETEALPIGKDLRRKSTTGVPYLHFTGLEALVLLLFTVH